MTSLAHPENGRTILLVDDDPDVRSLVATMLGKLGYSVLEACDGATGIKVIDTAPHIDVLITDMILPGGMSGLALARLASRRLHDAKFLFMSGDPHKAEQELARFQPNPLFLRKPFAMAELALKVDDAMSRGHRSDGHCATPGE